MRNREKRGSEEKEKDERYRKKEDWKQARMRK